MQWSAPLLSMGAVAAAAVPALPCCWPRAGFHALLIPLLQGLHKHRTVWLYGCSCTSSGAMYSGVPLMLVSTMVLQLMARANPKSHSFTVPPAPMRMFWGFISRWMMRLLCK